MHAGQHLRRDNTRRYDALVQQLAHHFTEYEQLAQALVARDQTQLAHLRESGPAAASRPRAAPGHMQAQAPAAQQAQQFADEVAERELAVRKLQDDLVELAVLFRDLQGGLGAGPRAQGRPRLRP